MPASVLPHARLQQGAWTPRPWSRIPPLCRQGSGSMLQPPAHSPGWATHRCSFYSIFRLHEEDSRLWPSVQQICQVCRHEGPQDAPWGHSDGEQVVCDRWAEADHRLQHWGLSLLWLLWPRDGHLDVPGTATSQTLWPRLPDSPVHTPHGQPHMKATGTYLC